jgi:hypothetical protein
MEVNVFFMALFMRQPHQTIAIANDTARTNPAIRKPTFASKPIDVDPLLGNVDPEPTDSPALFRRNGSPERGSQLVQVRHTLA